MSLDPVHRRLAEVPREQGYLLEIGGFSVRRQVPHLHILGHPLPEDRHGESFAS